MDVKVRGLGGCKGEEAGVWYPASYQNCKVKVDMVEWILAKLDRVCPNILPTMSRSFHARPTEEQLYCRML